MILCLSTSLHQVNASAPPPLLSHRVVVVEVDMVGDIVCPVLPTSSCWGHVVLAVSPSWHASSPYLPWAQSPMMNFRKPVT